jgi:hypothetical protein
VVADFGDAAAYRPMSPLVLHRVSAGLLYFFAIAHTGGMLDTGSKGVTVDLVVVGMRNARFPIMGVERTLYDFYFGFGMLLSVLLVLAGTLSLGLAKLATEAPGTARWLGLAHAGCLVLTFGLSLVFFFPAPTIISGLAMLCTAAATAQTRTTPSP